MQTIDILTAQPEVRTVADGDTNTLLFIFDTDDGETRIHARIAGSYVHQFVEKLADNYRGIAAGHGGRR